MTARSLAHSRTVRDQPQRATSVSRSLQLNSDTTQPHYCEMMPFVCFRTDSTVFCQKFQKWLMSVGTVVD